MLCFAVRTSLTLVDQLWWKENIDRRLLDDINQLILSVFSGLQMLLVIVRANSMIWVDRRGQVLHFNGPVVVFQ